MRDGCQMRLAPLQSQRSCYPACHGWANALPSRCAGEFWRNWTGGGKTVCHLGLIVFVVSWLCEKAMQVYLLSLPGGLSSST